MAVQKTANVFLVGAAKAGTTALANWLSGIPGVFVPSMKEPHYFSEVLPDTRHSPYVRACATAAEYAELFRSSVGATWRVDASPSYLWSCIAPSNISRVCPDAKIIISLREPIARCYSHYLMDKRYGLQVKSFFSAVWEDYHCPAEKKGWGRSHLYVELGQYEQQLARYQNFFRPDQILLLAQEDIACHEGDVRQAILEFLGLSQHAALCKPIEREYGYAEARGNITHKIMGSASARKIGSLLPARLKTSLRDNVLFVSKAKPEMDPVAEDWLRSVYRAENKKLASRIAGAEMRSVIRAAGWIYDK